MRTLAFVFLLVGCVPPHLAPMTTETGRGGSIDYDHHDHDRAEEMLRDYCGGSWRPTSVGTESAHPAAEAGPRNRIVVDFECEGGDAGSP